MTPAEQRSAERPLLTLVDDDAAVGDSLKFLLEMEGFDVATFPNATAVLGALPPDRRGCLVLDFNLPEMDGLDLLSRLRAAGVGQPAVLITSHPNAKLRARARARRVEIVEKPLLTNALVEAVGRAIGT